MSGPCRDISRGELDLGELGESSKEADKESSTISDDLLGRIKSVLADQVDDVRSTTRLTSSPACLVLGEGDVGPQMRKILEAAGQPVPETKPVLEINPDHELLARLQDEQDNDKVEDLVGVMFDQAVLSAGEQLENPALFVQRLNRLLFS